MSMGRRFKAWFLKHSTSNGSVTAATPSIAVVNGPTTGTGTGAAASSGAFNRGRSSTSHTNATEGGSATTTGDPAASRRRRRRRRRPASPVGLPLYSEEPGDDEMSLFKGADVSRTDLLEEGSDSREGEEEEEDDDDDDLAGAPLGDRVTSLSSSFSVPRVGVAGRGRSASDAPSIALSFASITSPINMEASTSSSSYQIPSPGAPSSPVRPIVHRSTQSSPGLSLSSSPILPRQRSSTLRSLFTRRNDSSSALSTSPGSVGRSPYSQGLSSGSTSRLASGSSTSIRSTASISAPLQHTLVSSSFVFPKTGPTASQIAFISSREALGAYGYGAGAMSAPSIDDDDQPPRFESGVVELEPPPTMRFRDEVLSPPPSATMSGMLSTGGTTTRGARSASVSSQMSSSPLARVRNHDQEEEEEEEMRRRLWTVPSTPMEEQAPTMSQEEGILSTPMYDSTVSLEDQTIIVPSPSLSSEPILTDPVSSTISERAQAQEPDSTLKIVPPTLPPLIFLQAGTPTSPLFPRSPGGTTVAAPEVISTATSQET